MKRNILGVVLCAAAAGAQAGEGAIALLGRFGTLGLGLEVGRGIADNWAVRAGLNGFSADRSVTQSNVRYDAEIDLRSAGVTFDWHPAAGAFRVSAGAFYNGTQFSVLGRATGGTFDFNGTTYNASEIASLSGKVSFKKFAPFIGVGFGNVTKRGFSYSVDLGALYQRAPEVELNVSCGVTAQCSQLTRDVQAEQAQLRSDVKDYRFWPVIQAGFGYVF